MSSSSSSRGPSAGSSSQGPSMATGPSSLNLSTGPLFDPSQISSQLAGDPALLDSLPGAEIYVERTLQAAMLKKHMDEAYAKILQESENLARLKAEEAKLRQGTATVYTEADVPPLVEALSSKDEKEVSGAIRILSDISNHQKDLLHSAILPHFPHILSLLFAASTETQVRNIAGLVMHTSTRTPEASYALVKLIDLEALFGLILRTSNARVRDMLVHLVENVMQTAGGTMGDADGGKMESRVVEIMHTQFYRFEAVEEEGSDEGKGKGSGKGKTKAPQAIRWNTSEAMTAIQSFQFIMARKLLSPFCAASIKAGVLQFLLRVATTPSAGPDVVLPVAEEVPEAPPAGVAPGMPPTLSSLRAAAVGSLSELYRDIVEQFILAEDFPHIDYQVDGQFDLQGQILMPLIELLDDPDLPVSDKVVDLLYSRFNDADQAVQIFLLTHEGAMRKLIRKLAIGSAFPEKKKKSSVELEGKGKGKLGGRPNLLEKFNKKWGLDLDMDLFGGQGPLEHGDAMQLGSEELALAASSLAGGQGGREKVHVEDDGSAAASVLPTRTGGNGEMVEGMDVSSPDVGELERNRVMSEMAAFLDKAPPAFDMAGATKQGDDDLMDVDGGTKGKKASEETTDSEMMDVGTPGEDKHRTCTSPTTETKHKTEPSLSHMLMDIGPPKLGLSDRFLSMLDDINAFPKTDPLLCHIISMNRDGVVEALSEFWLCESLEDGMKEKLVQELSRIHGPLRKAAFSAGIPVPSGSGAESFSPFT